MKEQAGARQTELNINQMIPLSLITLSGHTNFIKITVKTARVIYFQRNPNCG
jgi:hypothetical protein